MEGFEPYLEKIFQFPVIALVFGLIAILLAKNFDIIFSGLVGFLLGVYVALPKIAEIFPQLKRWISDPTIGKIVVVVFGVVSGAVVYALFRLLVFVAGFLISAALVYYGLNSLRKVFDLDSVVSKLYNPDVVYLVLSAAVGVWVGIIAQKRERDIFSALSILTGSALASISAIYLVLKYLIKIGDPAEFISSEPGFYIILATFVVLSLIGFRLNFGKGRKAGQES